LILKDNVFFFLGLTGTSETTLRGENLDFSHVELVILLMTAGAVIPIGRRIGSVLLIVALVLEEMLLVVVMVGSMLLPTPVMMILLTHDLVLCVMLLSRTSPSGLCSSVTWSSH
jgi:hypothetical protein